MAKNALSIPIPTPVTGRRRLAGGLFAIAAGGTLTSGIAAGFAAAAEPVQSETDAALIAACSRFNEIERQCRARLDVAKTADEEEQADQFRAHLCGGDDHRDWPALTRVCTTPGSSLAAAVALATTISIFDNGEIVALQDDPDDYVTPRLLAALMRCLLASA